jgi:hypothetical protein
MLNTKKYPFLLECFRSNEMTHTTFRQMSGDEAHLPLRGTAAWPLVLSRAWKDNGRWCMEDNFSECFFFSASLSTISVRERDPTGSRTFLDQHHPKGSWIGTVLQRMKKARL